MKTAALKEQFVTDAKGKRVGVLLDLKTYAQMREAQEELADIQASTRRVRKSARNWRAANSPLLLTTGRPANFPPCQ